MRFMKERSERELIFPVMSSIGSRMTKRVIHPPTLHVGHGAAVLDFSSDLVYFSARGIVMRQTIARPSERGRGVIAAVATETAMNVLRITATATAGGITATGISIDASVWVTAVAEVSVIRTEN